MASINDVLEKLGGLHDSRIEQFIWRPRKLTLELEIDDFYANLDDSSDSHRPRNGSVIFRDIVRIEIGVNLDDPTLDIHDFSIRDGPDGTSVAVIEFRYAGNVTIHFRSCEFPSFIES